MSSVVGRYAVPNAPLVQMRTVATRRFQSVRGGVSFGGPPRAAPWCRTTEPTTPKSISWAPLSQSRGVPPTDHWGRHRRRAALQEAGGQAPSNRCLIPYTLPSGPP
jgi:hypothetical protein